MSTPTLEEQARIFKALAHPLRLSLLLQLAEQERCVAELAPGSDVDLSTLSRHLAVLKQAGLVADRRAGKWIYYRLLAPCVLDFIDCLAGNATGSPCACEGEADELA